MSKARFRLTCHIFFLRSKAILAADTVKHIPAISRIYVVNTKRTWSPSLLVSLSFLKFKHPANRERLSCVGYFKGCCVRLLHFLKWPDDCVQHSLMMYLVLLVEPSLTSCRERWPLYMCSCGHRQVQCRKSLAVRRGQSPVQQGDICCCFLSHSLLVQW